MPIDPTPRRGRRDNGLDAAAYVPLADVDPRVGEHLLDVLRLAGVPAYLEPSADIEPYTRTLALPSPPTDRLWVDREQRAAARQIVEAESAEAYAFPPRPEVSRGDDRPSQGLFDRDEERAWEEIVAAFDANPPPPPVAPWPVGEDVDADADEQPDRRSDQEDQRPDAAGQAGQPGEDLSGEEHYQPPPPPPLPRPSRRTVLGIVLVVLGALLTFGPRLLGVDASTGLTLGVVSILAGGAVLVLGLRDSRSDDGPDDGAVV